jgi:ATP-dependent DNA helicase RecG
LGVNDSGEVTGVDPDVVIQIKKDFTNTANNPQKMNPPTYLSVDEAIVRGKTILHIFVPESSQVHRCNGRIYDRNEDGDLDITDHTFEVANLYQRKQASFTENKLYPRLKITDFRKDLIDKCRRIACVNTPGHPWGDMTDLQMLQNAQLYQADPQTETKGFTLACILLFGTDQLILSALPAHRTDLILRKVNVDRYDDRDMVRTNLIDSYDRIAAFAQKHLPDPFYLEGIERISLRDIIFREVASNLLIHRKYTNATPARLIIEYGMVKTENANRPHGFGALTLENFSPYPKNPVTGAFSREIHRADELGSGMRKLMRYGKAYGGADPELIEGDIFRMIIYVPEFGAVKPDSERTKEDVPSRDQVGAKSELSSSQVCPKSIPS